MDGTHTEIGQRSKSPPLKPPPPNFVQVFIEEGWRGIEWQFGARTKVNKRWVEECGGDQLKQRRQAFLRARSARQAEERQRTLARHKIWRNSI